MLSESQCMLIEKALTEDVEPRKLAAYLCLHMGLTVAEVTPLRLSDIDLESGILTIRNTLAQAAESGAKFEIVNADSVRTLAIPAYLIRFLEEHMALYPDDDCYVINAEQSLAGAHILQNTLFSINKKYGIADSLTASKLRNAFIRRAIESGVDLYTIGTYVGIRQLGELQKKFSEFLVPRPERLETLERYSSGYVPDEKPTHMHQKRMNLIVLGAGSQGQVVKETAEAIGVFNKIAFLDDDPENTLAIDSCTNYKKYTENYPIALPSFGNCELRAKWIEKLEEADFILPTLIHPMATVSPSAVVEAGTVVEMKAIVGTNAKIGKGCIISSGAIIDLNAVVGDCCHIGSAVTVKKDGYVKPFSRPPSGTVLE